METESIYLVLREKGIHTDGKTYCESETTILGLRKEKDEATDLLKKVCKKFHPYDQPKCGTYDLKTGKDTYVAYQLDEELEDAFWVRKMVIGEKGDCY